MCQDPELQLQGTEVYLLSFNCISVETFSNLSQALLAYLTIISNNKRVPRSCNKSLTDFVPILFKCRLILPWRNYQEFNKLFQWYIANSTKIYNNWPKFYRISKPYHRYDKWWSIIRLLLSHLHSLKYTCLLLNFDTTLLDDFYLASVQLTEGHLNGHDNHRVNFSLNYCSRYAVTHQNQCYLEDVHVHPSADWALVINIGIL
jgi:hypothetical protein